MTQRRHHTKLKREELALLRRYDLDELAFKTGVSKTTLWNALHGREVRQKTREKITAWTAKEKARDLKALKGSHLDVWRSRDGRCVRFLLVVTPEDAKKDGVVIEWDYTPAWYARQKKKEEREVGKVWNDFREKRLKNAGKANPKK